MAIAAICAPVVSAQGYSPAALELLKEQRLWFNTSNAAGAILDNTQNYSEVTLGYDQSWGDFHRPQQGQKVSNAGFDCEGFMNLNSALVWGTFSFKQRNIDDAQYNASITDPFRGMPYYYADEHISDWHNQYYDMRFRASTPLYWGKFAAGIEGVYRASLAAKQLDPRVDTRYFELGLTPGVAYAINKNHSIGADFQYTALKEDSRMTNVNLTVPQTYYAMYGLGVSVKDIGDGIRSDYHGHIVGGGLQYNYRSGMFNALISGDYSRHVENMDKTPTIPQKLTSVKDDIWKVTLQFRQDGKKWVNQLTLGANWRDIDGIQYLNEYDDNDTDPHWVVLSTDIRSTYKTTSLGAAYSIISKRAAKKCAHTDSDEKCTHGDHESGHACGAKSCEYTWRVDASVNYTKEDDKYLLPDAARKYENIYSSVAGKYNFAIGKSFNRRLLVGVNAGYLANLSGSFNANSLIPQNPTLTDFMPRDQAYLTSDAWNLGASATYSQQVKQGFNMNCYLRAEFNFTKVTSSDFSNRRYMGVALGFTF